LHSALLFAWANALHKGTFGRLSNYAVICRAEHCSVCLNDLTVRMQNRCQS
jgi:hypothetical protein